MKKLLFALTIATAIPLACLSASAETFAYTYTGNDGVVANGTLTGALATNGGYEITSGTMNLSGAGALDGVGVYVPNSGTGVFQIGGGTQLILDGTDSFLFPFTSQLIGNSGLFLFQMAPNLGLGLFSNEPNGPGYGMFGGNWSLSDSGTLDVTQDPAGNLNVTPEPSSLLLVGSGLVALAGMARRRFSQL